MTLNVASFRNTFLYQSEVAAAAVLADLDRIRDLDVATERLQSKWLLTTVASALVGVVLTITLAASDYGSAAAIVGLVAVAWFVFSLSTYLRHRRSNVDNRRYELAAKLLGLLRVDMARDQAVGVKLDLRRADHKDKFRSKGQAGSWQVSYYRDPWLRLSGQFQDGTSFELVKTELLQKRSKWHTSRSGKRKHKSKTKHGFEAHLRLRFKPAKYRHMAALQADAAQAVQLPPGVELKRLRHTDRELGLRVVGKGPWSVVPRKGTVLGTGCDGTNMLSLLFLSLFQILNLSKAIDKSAASGESA